MGKPARLEELSFWQSVRYLVAIFTLDDTYLDGLDRSMKRERKRRRLEYRQGLRKQGIVLPKLN